jgi:hypothetical protein
MGGNDRPSPAGGKHDHTGSGAYVMQHDAPNMVGGLALVQQVPRGALR